jgi:hypothetical protein
MEEEKSIVPPPRKPRPCGTQCRWELLECILMIYGWRVVIGFMWLRI